MKNIIYSSSLDTKTLELNRYKVKVGPNERPIDEDDYPYCEFNDDGYEHIYAESLVSQADADRLVIEKARSLRDLFQGVLDKFACETCWETGILRWDELPISSDQCKPILKDGEKVPTQYVCPRCDGYKFIEVKSEEFKERLRKAGWKSYDI